MIVHTLKMCSGDAGPEQGLFLLLYGDGRRGVVDKLLAFYLGVPIINTSFMFNGKLSCLGTL